MPRGESRDRHSDGDLKAYILNPFTNQFWVQEWVRLGPGQITFQKIYHARNLTKDWADWLKIDRLEKVVDAFQRKIKLCPNIRMLCSIFGEILRILNAIQWCLYLCPILNLYFFNVYFSIFLQCRQDYCRPSADQLNKKG